MGATGQGDTLIGDSLSPVVDMPCGVCLLPMHLVTGGRVSFVYFVRGPPLAVIQTGPKGLASLLSFKQSRLTSDAMEQDTTQDDAFTFTRTPVHPSRVSFR